MGNNLVGNLHKIYFPQHYLTYKARTNIKIINKQKVPRETSNLCLIVKSLKTRVDKIILIMFHVKHSFPQLISDSKKKANKKN